MRTYSTTSEASLLSSFDDLSIASTTGRTGNASASAGPRSSISSDGSYELILVPSPDQRRISSSSASSGVLVAHPGTSRSQINQQATGPKKSNNGKEKGKGKEQTFELPSSSGNISTSSESQSGHRVDVRPRRPRRGGAKTRARKDRAEVRKELDADLTPSENSTPTAPPSRRPIALPLRPDTPADEWSEDGASRLLDETSDDDDDDEVDGLFVLQPGSPGSLDQTPRRGRGKVLLGKSTPSTRTEGSVMSTDDAKSSIDSFLSEEPGFMSDKANKLRLWQALSIELGLVSTATDLPDLPIAPTTTTFTPPVKSHPLPQSLTSAQRLLKEHAHVNLSDYFAARAKGETNFQHLLYPSARSMIRATQKEGKFVRLPQVKGEWLQPLLKDFGFKRSRGAAS